MTRRYSPSSVSGIGPSSKWRGAGCRSETPGCLDRLCRRVNPIRRLVWFGGARRIRQLLVQRLTVPQAAAEKLGPRRDRRHRVSPFREKPPERGVMPASSSTAPPQRLASACSISSRCSRRCSARSSLIGLPAAAFFASNSSDRVDRVVDRARGLDGEGGGPARRQHELRRLRGLVDPFDVSALPRPRIYRAGYIRRTRSTVSCISTTRGQRRSVSASDDSGAAAAIAATVSSAR